MAAGTSPRIDGRAKVTGAARYAADVAAGEPGLACLVTSTDREGPHHGVSTTRRARAVPGVLDILTHENVGDAIKPAQAVRAGRLCRLDHPRRWVRPRSGMPARSSRWSRRDLRGGARRRLAVDGELRRRSRRRATFDSPGTETAPRRPMRPRPRRPAGRRRRAGASPPRRSRSTRTTRRRPSITIRSSCSPRPAPGTATSSPSTSPASTSTASSTAWPSSSASTPDNVRVISPYRRRRFRLARAR